MQFPIENDRRTAALARNTAGRQRPDHLERRCNYCGAHRKALTLYLEPERVPMSEELRRSVTGAWVVGGFDVRHRRDVGAMDAQDARRAPEFCGTAVSSERAFQIFRLPRATAAEFCDVLPDRVSRHIRDCRQPVMSCGPFRWQ